MTTTEQVLTDTYDMVFVHNAIRRALSDAPDQLGRASSGGTARANYIASYLKEVFWLVHGHHAGEDEILYPLLVLRAPEHEELFWEMEAQHAAVALHLDQAAHAVEVFGGSGSLADARAAAGACSRALATLAPHLKQEEAEVLPVASRVVSPIEWAGLPAHAMAHYQGDRRWLPFGLVFEAMPEEARADVIRHLPPPAAAMWSGSGSAAFEQFMSVVREAA